MRSPPPLLLLLLVVVVMVAAVTVAAPSTDTLHYAVREEIGVGSAIADIVTDAGLHVLGVDVSTLARSSSASYRVLRREWGAGEGKDKEAKSNILI